MPLSHGQIHAQSLHNVRGSVFQFSFIYASIKISASKLIRLSLDMEHLVSEKLGVSDSIFVCLLTQKSLERHDLPLFSG